ncbi:hypothetical protein [Saccharopolyspora elongata]|uniref:hypothetical protein n=1 Tax=Saccharopolyspora elongata TaxID=2530387 RepID=UPI001404EAF3|nr:hypothetical protein [Saccharopolyspora elongata]
MPLEEPHPPFGRTTARLRDESTSYIAPLSREHRAAQSEDDIARRSSSGGQET